MFDWLTQLQASPLTYLAVLGACALDAVLPIVPSEAVVIAASILATRGELSIAAIGDDQHRCHLLLQQPQGLAEALTTATGEDNQGVGSMGGLGCGVDQDARGDSPQPAEHDDHKPQAEDPAPRRPSAAAPDLGWVGCRRASPPSRDGRRRDHHRPALGVTSFTTNL